MPWRSIAPRNKRQTFPLLRRTVAEIGKLVAKWFLGNTCQFGHACPENGHEAERWLEMAVDGGYAQSVKMLEMIEQGVGVLAKSKRSKLA